MFIEALFKLIGWILFPLGLLIIFGAWLGYGGFWVAAGVGWLDFLNGSLVWAIVLSLMGGFITALSVVMARSRSY